MNCVLSRSTIINNWSSSHQVLSFYSHCFTPEGRGAFQQQFSQLLYFFNFQLMDSSLSFCALFLCKYPPPCVTAHPSPLLQVNRAHASESPRLHLDAALFITTAFSSTLILRNPPQHPLHHRLLLAARKRERTEDGGHAGPRESHLLMSARK